MNKELEALLLKMLQGPYTPTQLKREFEESFAAATIAKKREEEKEKQLDKWYDELIEHLDTDSLSLADVGIVGALVYAKEHPESSLPELWKIYDITKLGETCGSQPCRSDERGNGTWTFTLHSDIDPVRKFLKDNKL